MVWECRGGAYKHFRGIAQEPIRGPRGKGATAFKNSIPRQLCEEIIASLPPPTPEANTIIDLCAGFQSMREPALAAGFNYIAVDILGDRSSRLKAAAAA